MLQKGDLITVDLVRDGEEIKVCTKVREVWMEKNQACGYVILNKTCLLTDQSDLWLVRFKQADMSGEVFTGVWIDKLDRLRKFMQEYY